MAVLKKVQQTYLGLKSYSQKITATNVVVVSGRRQVVGQESELRYQQPNRTFIQVSTPNVGTLTTFNNGREMLVYRGSSNTYQKRPGQPTVKAYVRALREFGIGTMLDPLAFLTGEPVQTALASATVSGSEAVDGVPCEVVVGRLTPALASKAKSATATFWVDKSANLLRRVKIAVTGVPATARVRVMVQGKPVIKSMPTTVDQTTTMSIHDVKLNPPLNDASFTFALPKGATEQAAAAGGKK